MICFLSLRDAAHAPIILAYMKVSERPRGTDNCKMDERQLPVRT